MRKKDKNLPVLRLLTFFLHTGWIGSSTQHIASEKANLASTIVNAFVNAGGLNICPKKP